MKDVAQHETTEFVRLRNTLQSYESNKAVYIDTGEEEAYANMKAAWAELRGWVHAYAQAG